MATVHIPAAMRSLTNGEPRVAAEGSTLLELIDNLELKYPGLRPRLVAGDRLRGGFQVFVNDQMPQTGLRTRILPDDEVYFAPAIAGGC